VRSGQVWRGKAGEVRNVMVKYGAVWCSMVGYGTVRCGKAGEVVSVQVW